MDHVTNAGYSIAELRERNGVKPKELAARLNVTEEVFTAWETGAQMPSATQLDKLASEFGVPREQIRIDATSGD